MEQTSSSTTTSTTSSSSTAPNQPDHHHYNTTYLNLNLRQLNKSSHRISKPIIRRAPPPPPPPPPPPQEEDFQQNQPQPQPQPQPPVYNINKSDFRQVVQKLTGSPAHDHLSTTPPPPPPPKPQPSRLHRIRPPPLAHLITGPPPPHFQSTISPLSPLPPFPTVHAAAESPISAYMKYLRGTSEWFNPNLMPPPPPPVPATGSGSGSSQFVMPASPRSPYPLLSPSAQLGFQQFRS